MVRKGYLEYLKGTEQNKGKRELWHSIKIKRDKMIGHIYCGYNRLDDKKKI